MELITNAIKGTQDTLPAESYKVQFVESAMREIAENFGYREMRTPVFEHTELFQRGVGETTDVVQKEMYITLKRRKITTIFTFIFIFRSIKYIFIFYFF